MVSKLIDCRDASRGLLCIKMKLLTLLGRLTEDCRKRKMKSILRSFLIKNTMNRYSSLFFILLNIGKCVYFFAWKLFFPFWLEVFALSRRQIIRPSRHAYALMWFSIEKCFFSLFRIKNIKRVNADTETYHSKLHFLLTILSYLFI